MRNGDLAFTNNPGLKPERSRSFDLGIEQALIGSALVADLTWFANRYDDLIVTVGGRSVPLEAVLRHLAGRCRPEDVGRRWVLDAAWLEQAGDLHDQGST